MITWDNYEEYMMMHADGELQPHEELALQTFLNENPKLKAEMALYEQARLIPDHSQVYAQKDTLLKPVAENKIIALPKWRAYAAAAGVAAIFAFTVFAFMDRGGDPLPMVKVDSAVKIPSVIHEGIDTQAQHNEIIITRNEEKVPVETISPASSPTQVIPQQPKYNAVVKNADRKNKNIENKKHEDVAVSANNHPVRLPQLAMSPIQLLPVEKPSLKPLPLMDTYETATVGNEKSNRSWIDKLPIDELKKDGINNVANALATGYDQVAAIKKTFTEEGVTVKIKQRKLIISF